VKGSGIWIGMISYMKLVLPENPFLSKEENPMAKQTQEKPHQENASNGIGKLSKIIDYMLIATAFFGVLIIITMLYACKERGDLLWPS